MHTGGAVADSLDVTPANVSKIAGIPRLARMAFRALLNIRRGSLLIVLPDGRRLRFSGSEPGENAEMIIRDFGLTRR
ncbi:MAG: SAM-dependent methyltransferase, partial [Parvibaculum sp.]